MRKVTLLISFCITLVSTTNGQVVINELLPDPNPSVTLPEEEFIELYNTSASSINLENFILSDPSRSATLPNYTLNANAYIIICASANEAAFSPFGDVIGVSNFPSLNNSGDVITLRDNNAVILDEIEYTNTWYKDPLKDNGGWTLERINPLNSCDGVANWQASLNNNGGSPGIENSVIDTSFYDAADILILDAKVVLGNTITIQFSKKLNNADAENTSNYSLTPNIIIQSAVYNESLLEVELLLGNTIPENSLHLLTLSNVGDCNGLQTLNTDIDIAIPIAPEKGDILLNEILFNPQSGSSDFIEVVNVSTNIFSFKDLSILELNNNQVVDFVQLNANKLLLPNQYWVITEDSQYLIDNYSAQPQFIIEDNLPNYPDSEGSIALLNGSLDTLDKFTYHADFHAPLISNEDGVSLERLSLQSSTQNALNWTSAANTSGNATPTFENSNTQKPVVSLAPWTLSGEYFTPDQDGNEDFLFITFNEEVAQHSGTVAVYNLRGVVVKTLLNNQLIGSQFTLRWDGLDEDDQQLPIGHYILLLTTFDGSGSTKRYKESVVLSRKHF